VNLTTTGRPNSSDSSKAEEIDQRPAVLLVLRQDRPRVVADQYDQPSVDPRQVGSPQAAGGG